MKGRALFRRMALAFLPANKEARELMSAVPEGVAVFMDVWKPRNWRQHNKYFLILSRVCQATGKWTSTEHLRRDILIALHHYDEHVNQFTGEVEKIAHSMDAASMDKASFEQLYTDTMALLTDALGADPELLLAEAA